MIDIQKESLWNSSTTNNSEDRSIPPELLTSLRQHSLFQRTNNESFLEKLACCMHLRTYSPRDIIIIEGEAAKAMFFLLRGSVDVCSADFERIYATLPKGSCFGEIGILYAMPRTATVIASSKCIVAALTAEEVSTLLPQYPEVEKMLRFEAEERLALLRKSKNLNEAEKISRKPLTECNVEDLTSARNLLQKIPYFKSCPEEFLHLISLKVEPRHFAPNDLVICKGDQGKELFFIISGTVEVTSIENTSIDSLTPIERLSAGDYFGDIAVFLNSPRTPDTRAVTALELYVLKKSDFIDVISRFPDLQKRFKAMAESSLTNLRLKASTIYKAEDTTTASPTAIKSTHVDDPKIRPHSITIETPPIVTASSVCSTTSDQDPTLIHSTNEHDSSSLVATSATQLKKIETRRRRASVAIWSDPHLVALANKSIKGKDKPEESKLKEESAEKVQYSNIALTIPSFPGDGHLAVLTEDILTRIVNLLDTPTMVQFAAASNKCRDFIRHSSNIMHFVDFSHLNKRVTDSVVKSITTLVGTRPRHMNLSQCFYITDNGFKALIEHMSNIESMDLNSCWLLTDNSLLLLAAACPRLTKLDLSNCRKISDAGIFKFLNEKCVRGFSGLTDLSLSYCKKLSDMTMSHLAEFCSKTLTSLNIQRCTRITDQGFIKWADTSFPTLRTLNLTDCSFLTDQAISHLVSAAPHLHNLSLSFCCALSDNAIEGLISLPDLQDLDASFCGAAVSDVSIRALLSPNMKSITSLNLRGCVRVTDVCIKTIMQATQLSSLNISQCPGISMNAKTTIRQSGNLQTLVA